ncbi:hypothetical protein ACQKWADRAFT_117946 [Trichoderma austrokoningii]
MPQAAEFAGSDSLVASPEPISTVRLLTRTCLCTSSSTGGHSLLKSKTGEWLTDIDRESRTPYFLQFISRHVCTPIPSCGRIADGMIISFAEMDSVLQLHISAGYRQRAPLCISDSSQARGFLAYVTRCLSLCRGAYTCNVFLAGTRRTMYPRSLWLVFTAWWVDSLQLALPYGNPGNSSENEVVRPNTQRCMPSWQYYKSV